MVVLLDGAFAGPCNRALWIPFSMVFFGCTQSRSHFFKSAKFSSIVSSSDVNTMMVLAKQYAMLSFV